MRCHGNFFAGLAGLAGLAMLAATACSPLAHTVDNKTFRHLPLEKQMRLFDAENDVSIALDARSQMLEVDARLQQAVRRASRATAANHPAQANLALARQRYMGAAQDFMAGRIGAQNKVILAALAKYELAKAILVKKNNLNGAQHLSIAAFERQATAENDAAKRQLAALSSRRERATRQRLAWESARQSVAADSLGGTAAGDEEDPEWQAW